ncbi:MAG: hypothetical protein SXG53_02215, partial [Pseudomonadota bacterium]|nr:hypothetical protein [Pseudomonadota bacterium]
MTSRRTFLVGSAALPVTAALARLPLDLQAMVAADLDKYIGFGSKQAGGAGDMACGNWLAAELEGLGFAVERQEFATPFFEATRSELLMGDSKASLWPQPIVVQTGPDGITAPLVRIDRTGRAEASLDGAIALVDLPFGRWSSALAKPIREPLTAAFSAGAKAVVAITNGPTGKVIALNADGRAAMFKGPVALLAPENAEPFLAAAMRRAPATLIVRGNGGRRPAFNFVGRMDRGKPTWLVVSTPRSGWFGCAGERGPGVAAWLWLARWASQAVPGRNLAFVCNTGHEYEYLGAAEALKTFTPKPADTHFWLHLGANVAARDWHETVGQWRPLPSVDTQRFLSLSPALLPLAREVFAGHIGLEAPYSSDTFSAGELTEIIAAGYEPA